MEQDLYRYFMAVRPPSAVLPAIASARGRAGPASPIPDDRAHVTLASIYFGERCASTMLALVDAALQGHSLYACGVTLGHVESREALDGIAMLVADGDRSAILDLRAGLIHLLRRRWPGIPVEGGARPHLTLGYDPAGEGGWKVKPIHWLAQEIELIESWHGHGVHRTIGRWPLLPPPQYGFGFADAA